MKVMGSIKDKHKKRRDRDVDPLSGGIGNRKEKTRDFDLEDKTIKDKQSKE